ncbi:MAG: SAM-dependent methyltransferase, partial [Patescibacteria group bacterium]|nr:SAM-dependent methyltransferase [Patescibacteria group bacterium]
DIREVLSSQKNGEILKFLSKEVIFDVIVYDMAPKTTGVKFADADESLELSEETFKIAKRFLKKKGHLVLKIFESEETARFVKILKDYFKTVKRFSPEATRKQSREFYIICKEFIGDTNK